jgi:hypothetical protein
MARAGFVAHHVMEWVGWESTTFWYIAAGALVAAPLVAICASGTSSAWALGVQVVVAALACWLGLMPQFGKAKNEKDDTRAGTDLRPFMRSWEPAGRDRIASLRLQAERSGPRAPCLWYRLADLESAVNLKREASEDVKRASAPRSRCPKAPFAL